MKIKKVINSIAVGFAVCGVLSCSLTSYGATVDDVARVARELDYSEELIQQGYNNYYADPDKYPPEELDRAIAIMYEKSGMIFTTGEQNPTQPDDTTTTTVTDGAGDSTVDNNDNQPSVTGGITLKTSDGNEFVRISSEDFIKLSYDEKMNYIRNFTPEQQQVILDNLTSEERKSMMKQLPVEQKMELVDSMAEVGETLGINISVEEISDNNISLSMRNDDGEFVGVVKAGTLVEDTGYDRRGIFAVAGGFIVTALVMIGAVMGYFRKNGENNER